MMNLAQLFLKLPPRSGISVAKADTWPYLPYKVGRGRGLEIFGGQHEGLPPPTVPSSVTSSQGLSVIFLCHHEH